MRPSAIFHQTFESRPKDDRYKRSIREMSSSPFQTLIFRPIWTHSQSKKKCRSTYFTRKGEAFLGDPISILVAISHESWDEACQPGLGFAISVSIAFPNFIFSMEMTSLSPQHPFQGCIHESARNRAEKLVRERLQTMNQIIPPLYIKHIKTFRILVVEP
jgi:hypothetical protein